MKIIEVKHTYEVQDFYIRFPHYKKNELFMPVIRYILDGREVYQKFGKYLEENPSFAEKFSANALLCAQARLAAERARKMMR